MLREVDRVAARVRGLLAVDGDSADPVAPRLPSRVLASKRMVVIGIGIAVIAVIAIGAWLRGDRPAARPSAPPLATASPVGATVSSATAINTTSAIGTTSSAPLSMVVVDVAGKIRHPGVYRLPAGSRVVDALRAAGGTRAGVNLNGLNLAAVLVDGEQIAVGIRGAVGMGGAGETASGVGAPGGGPIDVNTATLEQLETLPGVGPVLGQQMLDWRAQHGGFTSVDQLDDVPGIGAARLAQLRPLVTV